MVTFSPNSLNCFMCSNKTQKLVERPSLISRMCFLEFLWKFRELSKLRRAIFKKALFSTLMTFGIYCLLPNFSWLHPWFSYALYVWHTRPMFWWRKSWVLKYSAPQVKTLPTASNRNVWSTWKGLRSEMCQIKNKCKSKLTPWAANIEMILK